MKITKYGFYMGVAIYMGALALFYDLPGNTGNTGVIASLFLIKMVADIALMAISVTKMVELMRGKGSISLAQAKAAQNYNEELEIVGHGLADNTYYLVILGYVAYNLWYHFQWNAATTGIESIFYALWCVGDCFLIYVAGHQAWMKFGGFEVKLKAPKQQ